MVAAGFIALVVALGALWRFAADGTLVQHALAAASHHLQAVAPAFVTDIFLY